MRYGQAPAGAVVATDPASADADCDYGAALRTMCGARTGCERANGRVETRDMRTTSNIRLGPATSSGRTFAPLT
jgi:hypothetical protein